ncbi:L-serine ammonia-lyase, iron-sulfur-dependent, subunit alpha [Myxococcota bacterium]|nr:L-serine ammonia-lyase, iron-sulfur-dependent, subunit alpha [Myxococcota bacterium]MBU1381673.1 L-serine ammonia-lyase, iron-sulfur-dependent, subunit alpha [Myxococcota bacterium]MBU1496516.1 L-serine ammonia-lyase, iron-sulfur-dependent, subunit alpha [Myxococcota bacterium]
MNILKEVLEHEVFPALGCTEPIAVAYAAATAAECNPGEILELRVSVDGGVYKNGYAVTVPNTGGRQGNLIAAACGALEKKPHLKMENLREITMDTVSAAQKLCDEGKASITWDETKRELFIEATVVTREHVSKAVIQGSHRNITLCTLDGEEIINRKVEKASKPYRDILRNLTIADFVEAAENLDDEDRKFIKEGIFMNMEMARQGQTLHKVGYFISDLREKGFLLNDVFSSSKILTAAAADARMAGVPKPVMASGGSGNQGIVAILVPFNVGKYFNIPEEKILKSIALTHLVNSYVKCFTGDLSPLCGCAIASGLGAATGIVYQHCGPDMDKITLAVNTVVSDLGGMLCDGAKGSCALKVASSTESAILAAYMAINSHGITEIEGFVGKTAEETIKYLGEIGHQGMATADNTMLRIMTEKRRPI